MVKPKSEILFNSKRSENSFLQCSNCGHQNTQSFFRNQLCKIIHQLAVDSMYIHKSGK